MARKSAAKPRMERVSAADPAMLTMTREQLLLHSDKRAAADELYRRAFNKYVKAHTEQ